MAQVSFKIGNLSALNTTSLPISDGQFIVAKDTAAGRAEIYVDAGSSRLRVGDFQTYATLADLNAVENPDTTKLYYIQDPNVLAVWSPTAGASHTGAFVQVNDSGISGISISGSGEVITNATVSADGTSIVFTKGSLAASDISYSGSTVAAALGSNASAIQTLNGDASTTGSVAKSIKDAVEGLDVSEFALASQNNNVVTIKGIKEVDGKIVVGDGAGISLEEVAYTGAAADVSVADSDGNFTATDVEGVLAEIHGNVDDLEGSLADVAKSGNAEDVAYDNTTSGLTADDVQEALDELAVASQGGVASKTIWFTDNSAGQSDYAKVYKIYQGANAPDAQTSPATLIGTINVPKDKVLQDAAVVDITFHDDALWDGATDVTELIVGSGTPTADDAGKYIKMEMQNVADPLYVSVKDLVDEYTAASGATQVQLAISNTNEISATLVAGGVDTTELADGAVTTAKIEDDAVTAAKVSIAAHAVSQTAGADGLAISVTTTDGQVSAVSGSIAANTYDAYGAASSAQTAAISTVVGTSGDASTADTVNGAKAFATSAAAGVVGTSGDASTANTVYGAKAYADSVVGQAFTWGTF